MGVVSRFQRDRSFGRGKEEKKDEKMKEERKNGTMTVSGRLIQT